MKQQLLALQAELMKNRYSGIVWVTFIAFGLAPDMGGLFIIIIRDPEALAKASGLAAKVKAMGFMPSWNSYLRVLTQAVGVGGVLVFGFVSSWIFGREYSDGTAKDLLSLPISRTKIINAKFLVYSIWSAALVLSNLLIGLLIGTILQLDLLENIWGGLGEYFITTVLTILAGVPIAFFATWGKGYLAPLGFVSISLVIAQIITAMGYGSFFPWAIPALYSGAGGEYKETLTYLSYLILIATSVAGYLATITYLNVADQTK